MLRRSFNCWLMHDADDPPWQVYILAALLVIAFGAARAFPIPMPEELAIIPHDGELIISVKVAEVWRSEGCKTLRDFARKYPEARYLIESIEGLPKIEEMQRVTYVDDVIIVTSSKPLAREQVARLCTLGDLRADDAPPPEKRTLAGKPYYLVDSSWRGVVFLNDLTFVTGAVHRIEDFFERPKPTDGPLTDAILAARDGHEIVAGCNPQSRKVKKALESLPEPNLGRYRCLLTARSATLAANLGNSAVINLRLYLPDLKPHEKNAAQMGLLLASLSSNLADNGTALDRALPDREHELLRALSTFTTSAIQALAKAGVEVNGPRVDLSLRVPTPDSGTAIVAMAMILGTQSIAGSYSNSALDANLVVITNAMLAYEKKHGRLPSQAIYDKDGKAILSWRVLLLPHLGEDDLFRKFKLDEPWDGPNNKKLIMKMPKVFQTTCFPDERPVTPYQVMMGEGTMFEGRNGVRLRDAADGVEQTMLIAEAYRFVPWSKPVDLTYHQNKPLPRLGADTRMRDDRFRASLANGKQVCLSTGERTTYINDKDGKVALIKREHTPDYEERQKMLRTIITRSGGETIDPKSLVPLEPHFGPVPYGVHEAPASRIGTMGPIRLPDPLIK